MSPTFAGRLQAQSGVRYLQGIQCDDGTLAEGVVDLAFYEEGSDFTGWTIVDFKTDWEFETSRTAYSTQVVLYVEAIKRATNSIARGVLLVL